LLGHPDDPFHFAEISKNPYLILTDLGSFGTPRQSEIPSHQLQKIHQHKPIRLLHKADGKLGQSSSLLISTGNFKRKGHMKMKPFVKVGEYM
jgi:hypothetical protein